MQTTILYQTQAEEILSHQTPLTSYICHGPHGVGKKSMMIDWYKSICPDIQDIRILTTETSFGVDIIQEMLEASIERPSAPYRMWVLEEADTLTEEASNLLLKTLEEGISGNIYVFLVESVSSLLPTIVSRSIAIPYTRIEHQDMCKILSSYTSDATQIHIASRLSQGSVSEALEYIRSGKLSLRDDVLSMMIDIKKKPYHQIYDIVIGDAEKIYTMMRSIILDISIIRLSTEILHQDKVEEIKRTHVIWEPHIDRVIEIVHETYTHLQRVKGKIRTKHILSCILQIKALFT